MKHAANTQVETDSASSFTESYQNNLKRNL